jgi:hypothetical protein
MKLVDTLLWCDLSNRPSIFSKSCHGTIRWTAPIRTYLLLDYTKYLKTTRKYLCELFPYSFWEISIRLLSAFYIPVPSNIWMLVLLIWQRKLLLPRSSIYLHSSGEYRNLLNAHQTFSICWSSGFSREPETGNIISFCSARESCQWCPCCPCTD